MRDPFQLRFSLRGVSACGLLTALVLVGCGGGVPPEQREAMMKIQDLGGRINFANGGYKVDLTKTPVENKDLAHLKHINNLKSLDLQGTRINDAGLEYLETITTLRVVAVERTGVTAEGAQKLKKSLPEVDIKLK